MLFKAASVLLFVLLWVPALVSAQDGFFQQFFNAQRGGGEAREEEPPPSGDSLWWNARVEAATCTRYLCPRTLSCVDMPSYCPCPFPQQVRCSYRDVDADSKQALEAGGNNCVSEANCNRVQVMRALGSTFKLSDLKLK